MENNEKGITLIALIITIIVMLILVAVTINVALNGGLFQRAKDASTKTQRAADREELQSAVFGTLNNNGNVELSGLTITGWTKTAKQDDDNKTYYEFTSKNNNKFYVYDVTGEILDELSGDGTDEENNILVGKSFYSVVYQGQTQYEWKTVEFISNTKAIISGYDANTQLEYDYVYENNRINNFWTVYILNDNIVIVAPGDEDHPNQYNVIMSNKGTGITPLTGKTFKKANTNQTIEFSNENGYGKAIDSNNYTTWYYLIDTGDVCKLYMGFFEWNVTKTNGEYTSFNNGTDTYELYTTEEP